MAEHEDQEGSEPKKEEGQEDQLDGGDGSGDDMNSTMMAIDVSQLDFGGSTKTEVKIELPTDDEIIQEKLEAKKSPLAKFFSKFKRSKKKVGTVKGAVQERSGFFKKFENVWLAPLGLGARHKLFFYLSRLLIVGISGYLNFLFYQQVQRIGEAGHPAHEIFMTGFGIELGLLFLSFVFRFSPAWLVTLPLTLFAVIFTYGVTLYHTADPLFFSVEGKPLSEFLNTYFLLVGTTTFVVSVLWVGQRIIGRILLGMITVLLLVAPILNIYLEVPFEFSFFGVDFLSQLPSLYFQPSFVLLQGLIPFVFLLMLVLSFGRSTTPNLVLSKGFARGFDVLYLVLGVLGLSLLQKNRVFHALNLLVPMNLEVGAVEIDVFNQKLKIETRNFKSYGGYDGKARYKMNLSKGQKDNQYLLQVVDAFNFPVKNLEKSDIAIFSDNQKIKKFQFKEDYEISHKRGNYILQIDLNEKKNLINWDSQKKTYIERDKVVFKIGDMDRVKRFVVKESDETYLDVKSPAREAYTLPVSYFDAGNKTLKVYAYDEFDQEIFRDQMTLEIKGSSDLRLLSPVQGDSVSDRLSVLILPKGIPHSDIKSLKYSIDSEVKYETDSALFFYNIDVSDLSEGPHSLTVDLEVPKGVLTKKATFYKKSNLPHLHIEKPAMGSFALRNTDVVYALEGGQDDSIAGVKAYVNGFLFDDFKVSENQFQFPISRWSQGELFLSIQVDLKDGTKLSDWVQVNKGLGVLDLSFDTKHLGFLNYSGVSIILDASVSFLDNWQGKEKWQALKKLMGDEQIDEKLKMIKSSVMVFGSEAPYYYKNCDDFELLIKPGSYNKTTLGRELRNIHPTGVSSLAGALKKAYTLGPEMIYIFTDSTDACSNKLHSSLQKMIEKNPKTRVVVFGIGQLSKSDQESLTELAKTTGGRFYQPDNYEILLNTFLKELVLSYELYSAQGELIKREPLGSRKFRLVPGEYTLKIPYGSEVKEVPFRLENNTKTNLVVSGENQKIHVKVSDSRI